MNSESRRKSWRNYRKKVARPGSPKYESILKWNREWARSNPRLMQHYRLLVRYGITVGEYEAMLYAQNGLCAVCKNPPKSMRLAVDHNHITGRIRGLLCMRCNTGIGKIERKFSTTRTPEFLLLVREYLLRPIPLGLEVEK